MGKKNVKSPPGDAAGSKLSAEEKAAEEKRLRGRLGRWKALNADHVAMEVREKELRAKIEGSLGKLKLKEFIAAQVKALLVTAKPVKDSPENVKRLAGMLPPHDFDTICPMTIDVNALRGEDPKLFARLFKALKVAIPDKEAFARVCPRSVDKKVLGAKAPELTEKLERAESTYLKLGLTQGAKIAQKKA